MVKKFSLILPTRDRLYLVNRLFDSIVQTASNLDSIEIVLCVDEGDTQSYKITHPLLSVRKVVVSQEISMMGDIFRLCYEENTSRYMILMNDDVIIRTKNWDIKILEAYSQFPDGLALVYPNDLYYGSKLSSFPVISRTVSDLMSGICPCDYRSHGIDSHIFDIFDRLAALGFERRKYLPKVIFEHMHYGVTLASYEGNFFPDHSKDQLLYLSLADRRQQTAVKMAQYIQSYPAKEPSPPLASVSIIMYTCGDLSVSARDCLETIYEDNKYRKLNYEIIIVSDGLLKKNSISSLSKGLRHRIKLICCENESAAEILHKAVSVSDSDYLVFLNGQCLPMSGWLQSLVEAAADGRIGIVGSKWINPRNGRIEHIGLSFYQDNGIIKETYLYKGLPSNHPAVDKTREVQAVKMPGMLVKKDVLLQMGQFDNELAGLEYLDMCLKVRKSGKTVIYSPQAVLYCDYHEFVKKTAPAGSGDLPLKLKSQVICDLEKQLAEDGFMLCSASGGHRICPADLCLSGEKK